ncbi:UNVERIFIED_CONTAM: hypothetical protein GTU68_048178 [Idotea baltica]|nr:hypothetical protein [Idotea baltica]
MNHDSYITRCIDLANSAGGNVKLNPNVGAVLVNNNRIIGEGYHQEYGGPHAEVNAINNVSENDKHLIPESTLYVSLEPCNIQGKTPPCSSLILKHGIKKLVVGCVDPNPRIAGTSLDFLAAKGVDIIKNVKQNECEQLIKPFKVNILKNRPYVTLKFAQSKDFYISRKGEQTWLSNEYSKVWSHKLRSENHGILIGTNTAIIDNPSLTNRLYSGTSPLRICIDLKNKISENSYLLSDLHPTLLINEIPRKNLPTNKEQWTRPFNMKSMLEELYKEKQIGRLIVEGGAYTLKRFIAENLWDRAFVINSMKKLEEGVKSPNVIGYLENSLSLESDKLLTILNNDC